MVPARPARRNQNLTTPQLFIQIISNLYDLSHSLDSEPWEFRMSARADPAIELAILLAEVADPYERAVQVLRDVRHLLPPEGVATARYGR
jgi:hypothetical protein